MNRITTPALSSASIGQRITRLRLWHVPLTSHTAYYMAEGKTCDTVETVVIALDTDAGLTGWGEVCPIPHYLPAYARGVAPAMQELAPVILGGDPVGAEALMDKADAFLPGHVYAKSALDIALWDITGQVAGLPLHALLGGRRQEALPLYHSITCVEPDEMARIAREAQGQGITQFQAKLGASGDWQTDVERLAKVREAVGPGPLVYGDWNCGATTLDAIRVGRGAAQLDVMLEAPCATLEDCARVQAAPACR
jgi:L-alanine-DL-glutamate epimerase and related enzymes of enolase superfamily